jgi:hypothetical protein
MKPRPKWKKGRGSSLLNPLGTEWIRNEQRIPIFSVADESTPTFYSTAFDWESFVNKRELRKLRRAERILYGGREIECQGYARKDLPS